MMLGFWVFIGTGIIFGRYYKVFFPANPKIGNSPLWFQVQRFSIRKLVLRITITIYLLASSRHSSNQCVVNLYQLHLHIRFNWTSRG